MSNTQTVQEEQSRTNLGPGDRLQAQRIAMGLTLEELAKKMRLSVAILKNLEENDFSQISAPIFVKGYLRSYARIVNADESEIINQYISDYTDEDPPISSTSNTPPEINADDSRVKWVTYLVVFTLISLLVIWWWNRYQQPAETHSLDTAVEAISAPLDSTVDDAVSIQTEITAAEPTSPITSQMSLEPEVEVAEPEPVETMLSDEPAIAAQDEPAPTSDEFVAPEPEFELQPVTDSDPEMPADTEADLVITVSADSWLDIKDNQDAQLTYDLVKAGEILRLSGQPPFRVFAGNAPGISIRYRGEEIDLSGRIRTDNTARIRVGQ